MKTARTFFGEPRALAYLAFTEAWERFSYYGMTAILVLYMSQALFLPGHVEHVVGFAALRTGLESGLGPLSALALSSIVFGLYTGFIYVTPILGGWIADHWLSPRKAVVIGALLMSAGHLAMAFDASFLFALLLLIVGCGLLKGNISTQVGTLYEPEDVAGGVRGFAIFTVGINMGAVAGPIACGFLAEVYGWHAGFGLAGVLMLIGLATYLAGYRELTDSKRSGVTERSRLPPLTREQRNAVWALGVVMLITVFQSIAYLQCANIAMVWILRDVDLDVLGFSVPVAWFNTIDSLTCIVAVPPLFALWRWQAMHYREPAAISKIGVGAWMSALANLLLAYACVNASRVSAVLPIIYLVIHGIGYLYYWPTLLALVASASPPKVRATMMGFVFVTNAIANFIIGWLGIFFERMSAAEFWTMHALIGATGGVIVLIFGRRLARVLGVRGA